MHKPVIAITSCSTPADYVEAVRRAGGEPRVIGRNCGQPEADPVSDLQGASGVVLSGGADIEPSLYGEDRHPSCSDAEPGRDEYELRLARHALAQDLPVLAICRGHQVLNVALGGTLIQDIPSSMSTDTPHDVREPRDAAAHPVRIVPGSRLEALLGPALEARTCSVNSRHHQAVGRLGEGLVVSATAPDGVVEAVERPASTFCVGVQWHPENFLAGREFATLFEGLVEAAQHKGKGERGKD